MALKRLKILTDRLPTTASFFGVLLVLTNLSCSTAKKENCFWSCPPGFSVPDCDYLCVDEELRHEIKLLEWGKYEQKENNKEKSSKEVEGPRWCGR